MSKSNLDAIRARWPFDGQWWFRDGTTVKTLVDGVEEVTVAECVGGSESAVKDAEFISHAFRDIYHLLAYVEQLESDLKTVQEVARANHDSLMRQRADLQAQVERVRVALEVFDGNRITGHEFANRVARALGGDNE